MMLVLTPSSSNLRESSLSPLLLVIRCTIQWSDFTLSSRKQLVINNISLILLSHSSRLCLAPSSVSFHSCRSLTNLLNSRSASGSHPRLPTSMIGDSCVSIVPPTFNYSHLSTCSIRHSPTTSDDISSLSMG